jgi:hypothetical protein
MINGLNTVPTGPTMSPGTGAGTTTNGAVPLQTQQNGMGTTQQPGQPLLSAQQQLLAGMTPVKAQAIMQVRFVGLFFTFAG